MTTTSENGSFDGAANGNGPNGDRRLATVRGLMAKAEATEFEHEAEAFFNKASELIARWAIDEAVLWNDSQSARREQPDELQMRVHAPYLPQKAILVSGVAGAHGCRSIRLSGGRGAKSEIISIIGFPTDLRWVETLVTSLLVQLTSTMLKQCPAGLSPSESASWRRSYIVGFSEIVSSRLKEDRRAAVAEHAPIHGSTDGAGNGAGGVGAPHGPDGASVALVLASREREVDADYRRRFPRVRSSWASSGSSASGRSAGRAAGASASLTRGTLGARGALNR